MQRDYTIEEIAQKIATDDRWLLRGLLAIYSRQTKDEQHSEYTKHRNDIGFNAVDGSRLTRYAKWVISWNGGNRKYRRPLGPAQLLDCRKRMAKYARQLTEIANERHYDYQTA